MAVIDGRGEYTLSGIRHTLTQHGLAPAKFCAHGDLAESFGFAGQEARRVVLVDHDHRHTEPPRRLGREPCLLGVVNRMEARADVEAHHRSSRMEVDDDMNLWPDVVAYKRRQTVCDPCQRRLLPGTINERAVQVHSVGFHAVACSRPKRFNVQHGNDDDPTGHGGDVNLTQELLQRDRPFVLVAVSRTERHQPTTLLRFRSDPHGERDQLCPPHRVVFESHPVIAPSGRVEVQVRRFHHESSHRNGSIEVRVGRDIDATRTRRLLLGVLLQCVEPVGRDIDETRTRRSNSDVGDVRPMRHGGERYNRFAASSATTQANNRDELGSAACYITPSLDLQR